MGGEENQHRREFDNCPHFEACALLKSETLPKINNRLEIMERDLFSGNEERHEMHLGVGRIEVQLGQGNTQFDYIKKAIWIMGIIFVIVIGFMWDARIRSEAAISINVQKNTDGRKVDHDTITRIDEGMKYIVKTFDGISVTPPTVYTNPSKGEN